MHTYDFDFHYTTEKGKVLLIQYTGEFDDTFSRVTKGRYLVDIDFIRWDHREVKELLQEVAPDLFEEIENAAVNDFMNRIEDRKIA